MHGQKTSRYIVILQFQVNRFCKILRRVNTIFLPPNLYDEVKNNLANPLPHPRTALWEPPPYRTIVSALSVLTHVLSVQYKRTVWHGTQIQSFIRGRKFKKWKTIEQNTSGMKVVFSYDVTPCCFVDRYKRFRVAFCHLQGVSKYYHNHGWTTSEITQKSNNDSWVNSCFLTVRCSLCQGSQKNYVLTLWSSPLCDCAVSHNNDHRGSKFVRNHLPDSQ